MTIPSIPWEEDPFYVTHQLHHPTLSAHNDFLPNGLQVPIDGETITIAALSTGVGIQWGRTNHIHVLGFQPEQTFILGRYAVFLPQGRSRIYFLDLRLFAANALDVEQDQDFREALAPPSQPLELDPEMWQAATPDQKPSLPGVAIPVGIVPLPPESVIATLTLSDGHVNITYEGAKPFRAPESLTESQLDFIFAFELQLAVAFEHIQNKKELASFWMKKLARFAAHVEIQTGIAGLAHSFQTLFDGICDRITADRAAPLYDLHENLQRFVQEALATAKSPDGPFWYYLLSDRDLEALLQSPITELGIRAKNFTTELARLRDHVTALEAGRKLEFDSTLDPWELLNQKHLVTAGVHTQPKGMHVRAYEVETTATDPDTEPKHVQTLSVAQAYEGALDGFIVEPGNKIIRIVLSTRKRDIHEFRIAARGVIVLEEFVILLPLLEEEGSDALLRVIDLNNFGASEVYPVFHGPLTHPEGAGQITAWRTNQNLLTFTNRDGTTGHLSAETLRETVGVERQLFGLITALSGKNVTTTPSSQRLIDDLVHMLVQKRADAAPDIQNVVAWERELRTTIDALVTHPSDAPASTIRAAQEKLAGLMETTARGLQRHNSRIGRLLEFFSSVTGHQPTSARELRNQLLVAGAATGSLATMAAPSASLEVVLGSLSLMQATGIQIVDIYQYSADLTARVFEKMGEGPPHIWDNVLTKPLAPLAAAYLCGVILAPWIIGHPIAQFVQLRVDMNSGEWAQFREEFKAQALLADPTRPASNWQAFRAYLTEREHKNMIAYGYVKASDTTRRTFRRAVASLLFGYQAVIQTMGFNARSWNIFFKARVFLTQHVRSAAQTLFPEFHRVADVGLVPSRANGGLRFIGESPHLTEDPKYMALRQRRERAEGRHSALTHRLYFELPQTVPTPEQAPILAELESLKTEITACDAELVALDAAAEAALQQRMALELQVRKAVTKEAYRATGTFVGEARDFLALDQLGGERKPSHATLLERQNTLLGKLSQEARRFYARFYHALFSQGLAVAEQIFSETGTIPSEDALQRALEPLQAEARILACDYARQGTLQDLTSADHWRLKGQRIVSRVSHYLSSGGLPKERAAVVDRMAQDPKALRRAARAALAELSADKPQELLITCLLLAAAVGENALIQDEAFGPFSFFGSSKLVFGDGFLCGVLMGFLSNPWMKLLMDDSLKNAGQEDLEVWPEGKDPKISYLRYLLRQTFRNPENGYWYNTGHQLKIIVSNLGPAFVNISLFNLIFLGRFDLDLYVAGYLFNLPFYGFFQMIEAGFERSADWFTKDLDPRDLDNPEVQRAIRGRLQRARWRFNFAVNLYKNIHFIAFFLAYTLPAETPAVPAGVDPDVFADQWASTHGRQMLADAFGGYTPTEQVYTTLDQFKTDHPAFTPFCDALKRFIHNEGYPRLPIPIK